ncbi:Scr1 family TA system antitoxin-like transcriptional regulator [Streptomyces albidoflavus]
MCHVKPPSAKAPAAPASIVLGLYLRGLREARGMSLADAARAVGATISSVSRWELGTSIGHARSLEALLRHYRVERQEREYLVRHQPSPTYRRREKDEVGPARRALHDFFPDLTGAEAMVRYLAVMRLASSIIEYRMRVPAGLRTPAYRAALAGSALLADADESVLAKSPWARRLQQAEGQRRTVLLDETVLTRPLGGPLAMAGQLRHLAGLVDAEASADGLTIRLLPMTYVGHLHEGPAPAVVMLQGHRLVTYLGAHPAYETGSGNARTISEALHDAVPAACSREETLHRLREAAEAMERGATS